MEAKIVFARDVPARRISAHGRRMVNWGRRTYRMRGIGRRNERSTRSSRTAEERGAGIAVKSWPRVDPSAASPPCYC
jgi:hypothetical protein